MSGMILCRSEYSKRPYYIEGAGVNVYSIEEISKLHDKVWADNKPHYSF